MEVQQKGIDGVPISGAVETNELEAVKARLTVPGVGEIDSWPVPEFSLDN